MRLLLYTEVYPPYLGHFYKSNEGLAERPFAEQREALQSDRFPFVGVWSRCLPPLGYEVAEVVGNVVPMQRAWAREQGLNGAARLADIAVAQMRQFRPEVLWFDCHNATLLHAIREQVPGLRVVLGSVGSAVPHTDVWRYVDVVISCAPEAVAALTDAGVNVVHLDHGFDPSLNAALGAANKTVPVSFVGSIFRGADFHMYREQVLTAVVSAGCDLRIYSPSASYGWGEKLRTVAKIGTYAVAKAVQGTSFAAPLFRTLPGLGKAATWNARPMWPVNKKLKRFLKPAVFGLKMYQALKDSCVSLNVHADSSPRFASNMRLFEATGVGTCLLTDWKENMATLFEPDQEVLTYRSVEECVDKLKWLLDRPAEREAIARAGQQRCLRDHTYAQRALQVDQVIRRSLDQEVSPERSRSFPVERR